MKLSCSLTLEKRKHADVMVIPFWIDKGRAVCAYPLDKGLHLPMESIALEDFTGRCEETVIVYTDSSKEKRLLFLGLGAKEDMTTDVMRRAYAAALRLSRKKKWKELTFLIPSVSDEWVIASIEGAMLANYSYDKMKRHSIKQDPISVVEGLQCIGIKSALWQKVMQKQIVVRAVNFARDLVNSNADDVTPSQLCLLAKELSSSKIKVSLLRKKELEKEKMGLLLAVGQGARHEPALVVMEYKGSPSSKETIALIGKGITYDTGGLNLKISGSMETMKSDMAGSAAVLAVLKAAEELELKCNIIGVMACAENAIGPNSYKPGDVIIGKAARSVEVNDTDAEGRLVLADALAYVQEHYNPSKIIDLATLTGGVVVALGEEASGLFCNNETLASELIASAEATSERVWRMPLYPEYKDALKSLIADMKNSGGRKASSSKGAVFLQQFIEKGTPWAHLDIAGTAYLSETKVYHPTLATGVGVRLLLSFLGGV